MEILLRSELGAMEERGKSTGSVSSRNERWEEEDYRWEGVEVVFIPSPPTVGLSAAVLHSTRGTAAVPKQ